MALTTMYTVQDRRQHARSIQRAICLHTMSDTGPLNRAEWIKFVSLFFNKEAEANELFANISAEYERYQVRCHVPGSHRR